MNLKNNYSSFRTKMITTYNKIVIYSELWTNGVINVKAMSVLVCMYTPGDLEKFQTTDHSNHMYY